MEKKFEEYEKMLQDVSDIELDEEASLKRLKKQIDKRIAVIAARIVIAAMLIFAVLLPLIDYSAKGVYNVETKLQRQTSSSGYTDGLTEYMRDYFGTFMPYAEVYEAKVDRDGFGKYRISLQMADHRHHIHIGGGNGPNGILKKEKGRYFTEFRSEGFIWLMNRFQTDIMECGEKGISALEKLPDSVYIYGSVRLKEPVPVHELAAREDISLLWAAAHQDANQIQAGIPFGYAVWLEERSLDAESVRADFLKHLQVLLGEPQLLESLGIYSDSGIVYSHEALQDVYEAVREQDMLYTDRICICGEKEKVIDFLREADYEGIYVDDVRLSIWSD